MGKNVKFGIGCIIEDDVVIGDDSYIDSYTIIRKGTTIGENAFIGANCIVGEYCADFIESRNNMEYKLTIGKDAIIRSNTIIYTNSVIGDGLNTGHHVTIRENSTIGNHVCVGTLSDIQGRCLIGSYVRMHSNVHIGQYSRIDSFVFIFPYVVLTNDPTPPSEKKGGVHIRSFAVIAASATILPDIEIMSDSLVAAGATVNRKVEKNTVVGGCPARVITDIREISNHYSGELAYPWREHYDTYMPWRGIGFNTWYNSLTESEKAFYGIQNL